MKRDVSDTDLRVLAERALRKNQPRGFQLPWPDAIELPNLDELAFIMAASPAKVLRLLNRVER